MPILSNEYEVSVLGSCLNSKVALHAALDKLNEDDFYTTKHKMVFRQIVELDKRNEPVDVVSIFQRIKNGTRDSLSLDETMELKEFENYIIEISDSMVADENIVMYIRKLRELSQLRKFKRFSKFVESKAEDDIKHEEILKEIDLRYQAARFYNSESNIIGMNKLISEMFEDMENKHKNKDIGIKSGIKEIDEIIGYFSPAELIVIAARPSMGKTSLMASLIDNFVMQGLKPGYISLEEQRIDLAYRLVCKRQNLNLFQVKKGFTARRDLPKISMAAGPLSNCEVVVDDTADLTARQIRSIIRQMVIMHKIDIVLIDHLHRFNLETENENVGLDRATKDMKSAAKELQIPVILSAQLSRHDKKSRTVRLLDCGDKVNSVPRPVLTDLRASGGIEQNADTVIFIHREEYYTKHQEDFGKADIIVAKQRFGPIDDTQIRFVKESAYFKSKDQTEGW